MTTHCSAMLTTHHKKERTQGPTRRPHFAPSHEALSSRNSRNIQPHTRRLPGSSQRTSSSRSRLYAHRHALVDPQQVRPDCVVHDVTGVVQSLDVVVPQEVLQSWPSPHRFTGHQHCQHRETTDKSELVSRHIPSTSTTAMFPVRAQCRGRKKCVAGNMHWQLLCGLLRVSL